MMQANSSVLTLGLLALLASSGCQTFGTSTVRGQSPIEMGGHVPKSRTLYHTPIRSAADEMQDKYHEHHNTTTYQFGPDGALPAGYQNCPPGGAPGYCPPAGANCPPNGAYCPPQSCPPQGHCQTGLCQDRFSYGYQVPNDLVYPPAGGVGGAVVYPYYTHKGPSDFFRQ